MPDVALQNLGCAKNQIDGERILHLFRQSGYGITGDFSTADIIIVNTCAFIREAQEEAIDAICGLSAFKQQGRCRMLIVSGCFSQRYRDEIKRKFPEVDLWTGVHDWDTLLERALHLVPASGIERELKPPYHVQHLKIAEGCSHGCAYCIIPAIRGPFKSRTPADIMHEAHWLEKNGVRELILVAQDSSFYGRDSGGSLARLVESLLAETAFPWIRLMYLHPAHVDDDLLRLFSAEPRLCPYFDIPLQHIADQILAAMGRRPLSSGIRNLFDRIRAIVPDAGLRTSFILGFPGENGSHFRQLVKFIEEVRFDKLGVFPFSPEKGTRAFSMRPRPRDATVMKRCEEIMTLQREISALKLASKINSSVEVIVDGLSDDPGFSSAGRTRLDAPEVDGKVYIKEKIAAGTITNVIVTDSSDHDLFGERGEKANTNDTFH
jgi:ribosomal protein S12 methylthiotransferase